MERPLTGKTFLVTGATDGIGRHTALKLYNAGARVFVHGRDPSRVGDVVTTLEKTSGRRSNMVQGFVADFCDFDAVTRFATEVIEALEGRPVLTGLINNAGVYEKQFHKIGGLEKTWKVNVASPYLLTSLLINTVLQERVINVASISAANHIDFHNLQQERGFSSHGAYSLSKLCNIMFSMELAERLEGSGVRITSNALDPGTVNTKMLLSGWGPIGIPIQQANDVFQLATSENFADVTGQYFVSLRQCNPPAPAYDMAARHRLWDILQSQTGAEWK